MSSLDLADRLRRYLISAPPKVRSIEVLSFSHPLIPEAQHVWCQARAGQVRTEVGDLIDVLCLAFALEIPGVDSTLEQDFSISVDTTDANDKFRELLDLIPMDNDEPVKVMYREYLSDDLMNVQAWVELEVVSCEYEVGQAVIGASLPRFNDNRTGEILTPRDVPMLRAFL